MGLIMEATIDRFGRIVIPKKIRDDFNLKPGSQIHFEEAEKNHCYETRVHRTESH